MTAVTGDGRTIVGVPMNEDTFTVQLMDSSERIHSLEKKTLKSLTHENRSLMPAYDASSSEQRATWTICWRTCNRCARRHRRRRRTGHSEGHDTCRSLGLCLRRYRRLGAGDERAADQRRARPSAVADLSGAYDGSRFSPLDQINRTNVNRLALQWVFQTRVRGSHETTPLVIDGVMYLTTPQNHAYAIDVRTGRPLWHYERTLPKEMSLCCGPQNRGFAALGDRLFMATLDAHIVALDAKTGACAGTSPRRTPTRATASRARRWS